MSEKINKTEIVQHTPEPWIFHENGDGTFSILNHDKTKWVIGFIQNGEMMPVKQKANAERMISCVNACAGITNEELAEMEKYFGKQGRTYYTLVKDMREAQNERDSLLKALSELLTHALEHDLHGPITENAKSAIEKVNK